MLWPLIWVRLLLLRAAVRVTYGKGTQYHWSVTPNGRVFLTSIDWVPCQKKERVGLKPPVHSNARLVAACDGRPFTPEYLRLQPLLLGEKGLGDEGKTKHDHCPDILSITNTVLPYAINVIERWLNC